MKALIVHLSDIHLRENQNNPSVAKFAFIAPALQNEEPDIQHVIVVVSGDIAYSGKSSEYTIAKACLDTLTENIKQRFSVDAVRCIFVPGNHDCDFSLSNKIRSLTIDAVRAGDVPDADMIEWCCKPQSEFVNFRDQFPNAKPDESTSLLHWKYRIAGANRSIEFRCYNTAWMSVLKEVQGTLQVPDVVCECKTGESSSDYVVSVFHHPYNWMPSATFRKFKSLVEESSDLVMTGHEHEPDHYQKYSFKSNETNDYLEGAVFQENGRVDRAGFHAVFVDLNIQMQRIISYNWDKDRFVSEPLDGRWVPYKRGSRGGYRDFDLADEFNDWLEDPGASYQHPAKPVLKLSDIYVFPNLKPFEITKSNDLTYGSIVEGRDLLKTLGAKRKILLFGRQQAGKTTLAKVLFSDLYDKNLTPVYISGNDLKKAHLDVKSFEKLVELNFSKQYKNPNLPAFQQVDKEKSILIIDDFDHASVNAAGRLKLLQVASKRYGWLVVFADDILKLEEFAIRQEGGDIMTEFDQFEIMQFGHLLRSKLITKWYSLGSEYDADQVDLVRRINRAEQIVSTMLGKNYLPHLPVFILTLIQANESVTQPNSSAGTYGSLYEVIITQSLASKVSKIGLDTKMAYLCEIAHWMHDKGEKRITDEDWEYFHKVYCGKYKINPSIDVLKDELASSGIFDYRDEAYGFRHSAVYYYFVARYFRDNLSSNIVRKAVAGLLSKLYKEEHASIWLFLTHLSKDPFLLDTILEHAKRIYADLPAARFEDDVLFLQGMVDTAEKVVLKDKAWYESKDERLRSLDSAPALSDAIEEIDVGEEETNETLKLLAQMNLALRTLEVLGQLVKNFPGSLKGDDKLSLIKECYSLGLRVVSLLFNLFQRDVEGFVDFVYDRLIEKHKEINDREELKKKVRNFTFWMVENATFGMVKRISKAVGHSQLSAVYNEIKQEDDSNAFALIDIAIRLENMGFPESRLKDLAKRFGSPAVSASARPLRDQKQPMPLQKASKNAFCEQILKNLVVEHFYLFPTLASTKQKVCAALQIEVQGIQQIEATSDKERRAPRDEIGKPRL